MPRIALLISGATGYWAEQALTAYDRFMAAGADVVVMTPDGSAPVIDPHSLDPTFHLPAEDRGYHAAVCRTFHRDPDHIRITLHHIVGLELAASRRIARRLVLAGHAGAEAHDLVCRAAKIAWRQDRKLVDVMVAEGLDGGLSEDAMRAAVAELELVSAAMAEECAASLAEIDDLDSPLALAGQRDAQLEAYDALLVPGGRGALEDLPFSPDVARLLTVLDAKRSPIATIGHGAAALLAAPDRIDGQWLFEGFRVTTSTDEEEDQDPPAPPWYVAAALQNAGAILDDAPAPWTSHVVVDQHLITGQNLYSTEATVGAVLKALDLA
ncbi:DJ-1/PfpI family protein [Nocardioides sp. NPDC101246]|uniref:DJ-1/PfpI family protein n=1 Tax=Nocardioides sp. NPDC101246 TaxID=3364336 RepID=UPI003801E611